MQNLLNTATFHRLSVVRTKDGFESSMQIERGSNSYRCGFGATASEAILELLAPVHIIPPPPPY